MRKPPAVKNTRESMLTHVPLRRCCLVGVEPQIFPEKVWLTFPAACTSRKSELNCAGMSTNGTGSSLACARPTRLATSTRAREARSTAAALVAATTTRLRERIM